MRVIRLSSTLIGAPSVIDEKICNLRILAKITLPHVTTYLHFVFLLVAFLHSN